MSTAAQVSAAWEAAIFNHATILAITDKAHDYEVTDISEKEVSLLSFEQHINFIEYVVTRAPGTRELGGQGSANCLFFVEIRYTREKVDNESGYDGTAYIAVRDFFDTLFTLVEAELGTSWDSTVDFWNYDPNGPQLLEADVSGRPCWRGIYRFTGVQYTTI